MIRFTIYTIYVFLFILNIFLDKNNISFFMGLIGIIALVISFKGANATYKVLSILFFIVSISLFIIYELPINEVPFLFNSMALLLSLLYMIPFINYFIKIGKYEKKLYKLLQTNTKNLGQFYWKASLTHYLLVLFVFFSAIPIVYKLIQQRLKEESQNLFHSFATKSMLRSFASANIWNPIEVYIALILIITNVSYLSILPILLGISFFVLMIDWLFSVKYRKYNLTMDSNNEVYFSKKDFKKLIPLGLFLLLFICSTTLVHFILGIDFFESIIIVIIPYTTIWALSVKQVRRFVKYIFLNIPLQTKSMQNFMFLFLSLGFFNEVIERTNIFDIIQNSLSDVATHPIILLFLLQLSALLLAYIGVHPLVTISLQGLFMEPFLGTINPMSVAIVMITSTLAADASGTFNVPITMMVQYMKRNPYKLTWWNLPFSLFVGVTGVVIAYILL